MELVFLQREPCNGADLACFPSSGKVPVFEMRVRTLVQGREFPPPPNWVQKDWWDGFFWTTQP